MLDLFLSTFLFCAILSGIFKTLFFHYLLLTCEYGRCFYINFVSCDFTKFVYWFSWLFCTFLGVFYVNNPIICKRARFCPFSELCLSFLPSWLIAVSGRQRQVERGQQENSSVPRPGEASQLLTAEGDVGYKWPIPSVSLRRRLTMPS